MTGMRIALLTISTLSIPTLGWGQDGRWTPEVSASVGLGHVFRFDDETFGDRLNAGVAVAIAHRSGLVIELDVERVFGLEPKPAPCGLVNNTCIGNGRYGPRQATVASLAINYRFKGTPRSAVPCRGRRDALDGVTSHDHVYEHESRGDGRK